jgi:hypothetical protein
MTHRKLSQENLVQEFLIDMIGKSQICVHDLIIFIWWSPFGSFATNGLIIKCEI